MHVYTADATASWLSACLSAVTSHAELDKALIARE